ncbi:MAG: hypothetical protein WEC14_10260 [Chloroflexota bacterium]
MASPSFRSRAATTNERGALGAGLDATADMTRSAKSAVGDDDGA